MKIGTPSLAECLNTCICREYVHEEKKEKFYFEVVSLTEQYYFKANSAEERADWINILQYHINLELSRLSLIKDTIVSFQIFLQ